MQASEQVSDWGGAQRKRVEAVVESLSAVRGAGETLDEVAHDARNMVTALGLYCDLLEEPGVLAAPYLHYGNELRLIAAASRRLVEKLVALDAAPVAGLGTVSGTVRGTASGMPAGKTGDVDAWRRGRDPGHGEPGLGDPGLGNPGLGNPGKRPVQPAAEGRNRPQRWDLMPALPIESLAGELMANRNLLAALAGPTVTLAVEAEGGARPVQMNGEDLTRILVNLVKNAAEAMPAGGRITLRLTERAGTAGSKSELLLSVEDTGPGIPAQNLDKIFEAGFSTQSTGFSEAGWPTARRGLGLSITRSILEAAGGRIRAVNRSPSGARFELVFPVREAAAREPGRELPPSKLPANDR
jgi:hypothetical protein